MGSTLRRIVAVTPTAAAVAIVEAGKHAGFSIPVPFLLVFACVTVAGAVGGRVSGVVAGLMAAVLVAHAHVEGFGPRSLTGEWPQVLAGMALYVVTGFALGQLRDERDRSMRLLVAREQRLQRSLDAETAETERQQALITESEARLEQAVRIAGLGHYIFDAVANRSEYCSEEHAAQHGLTPEQYMDYMTGPDGELSLVHPDDRAVVRENYRRLRQGTPIDFEYRIVTPAGETRHLRETAEPVFDANGRVVREVGTSFDVTALRAAEEQLRQTQKMEAVGRLTAGVAHDFNNILAVIVGNLELMERRSDDPETGEMIAAALRAARRGAGLTAHLLAFGRQARLEPEAIDANAKIRGMNEMLRRTLPATISIETRLAPGLRPIRVDPTEFDSALLNLVINARDAMPEGGRLTIETANVDLDEGAAHLRVTDLVPGRHVMITVRDTGTGMSEDARARAFEPFFTTKPVGEGSGLGLAMVYGFAQQSGGAVRLASEPGRGTTARLYFPETADAVAASPAPAAARTQIGGDERVLVVEDTESVRAVVARQLRSFGYEVAEAEDGASALALLRTGSGVDLMLTDLVMPGEVQGAELAEIAAKEFPHLKIVFMSGYSKSHDSNSNSAVNGIPKLTKPVQMEDLARVLRHQLDGN